MYKDRYVEFRKGHGGSSVALFISWSSAEFLRKRVYVIGFTIAPSMKAKLEGGGPDDHGERDGETSDQALVRGFGYRFCDGDRALTV